MFDFWLGCWYRVCTSEPFKNMKPDGLQTFLNGRLVQSLQLHLRNGRSCIGARLQAITGVGSALKGMRGHGCPEATRATRAQDCSHKWAAAIQRFNGSLDGFDFKSFFPCRRNSTGIGNWKNRKKPIFYRLRLVNGDPKKQAQIT